MKSKLLALLFTLLTPLFSKADNMLRIKNNSGQTIYAAYVVYDNQEHAWVSRGWFVIQPYQAYERGLNGLNLGSNTMYYYAETMDGKMRWEGDRLFRVDNRIRDFNITFADQINSNTISKKFNTQIITSPKTEIIFNP